MACQTSTGVAGYENCGAPGMGLASYNPSDPLAAQIKAAVMQSQPSGAPSDYPIAAEACLRAGGILYWHQTPGDCQTGPGAPGITSGQITGLSGSAASGVIGGLGAAGVIGGAATLGIGAAVAVAAGAIETVFANHAAAVANEQQTICSVALYFNTAKKQVDAAVRSGQITSDAGAAYLTQIANQAISGLAGIMKVCNAACVYQGILRAFINFSHPWYDSIAPTNIPVANAPGGPPTFYTTNPAGVTATPASPPPQPPLRSIANPVVVYSPAGPGTTGPTAPNLISNNLLPGNPLASDYLNRGYNQPTGQAAQGADVPNVTVVPSWFLPAVIVVVVVAFLVQAKG